MQMKQEKIGENCGNWDKSTPPPKKSWMGKKKSKRDQKQKYSWNPQENYC